jgi:hypothetical protein
MTPPSAYLRRRAEIEARLWAHSTLETPEAATLLVDDRRITLSFGAM